MSRYYLQSSTLCITHAGFYCLGMEKAGNRRPGRQSRNFVKGRKTMEVKAEIPVKQPVVENMPASKREQVRHTKY